MSPYDAGQGWVGVNCKDQGKHCKAIKVFPQAENTKLFPTGENQCRKNNCSKNNWPLPVSGMTIQMTLKMNAVK